MEIPSIIPSASSDPKLIHLRRAAAAPRAALRRAIAGRAVLALLLTAVWAPPAGAKLPPWSPLAASDASRAAPFAPTLLPSSSGSPVDCVILAPDSLADRYQPLADYQTRIGIRTAIRSLSTVRAADPRSNDLPQAIRSFLKSARDLWGTRWAILGADAGLLPVRYAEVQYFKPERIPTDAYYSDLDGTWDGNGNGIYGEVADSLDMEPDVAVGRLPAENRSQAELLVAKTLRYATNPIPAPLESFLTLAEVLLPSSWQPGQLVSSDGAVQGESLLVKSPSCAVTDRYYENHTRYPGSIPLTKPAALSALSRGYGVVNHIGHGSRSQLSVGSNVLTLADIATAANGDSLGLWIASNCASAAIDYDCVAERMVRNPNGGAFAYIGATREAFPGVSAKVSETLFERLFGSVPTTLGEALEETRAALLPAARVESQARWGYFETVLLGAPTIPIWSCAPATLTVSAPASVALSAGGFTVSVSQTGAPVESALVVAWKDGEEYRLGYTDPAGIVALPFHPASVGPFSLAVSRPGRLPHLDSLTVTADAPAHFAVVNPAVHDAPDGDGDGSAGAGERFGLSGLVRNTGGSAAAGPLAIRLEAVTAGLVVEQGEGEVAALAAGAETALPDSFRILAVATPNAPRGETLRVIAGDGSRADTVEVSILVSAPSILLARIVVSDTAGGNGNGVLESGETATFRWDVGNEGSGRARGLVFHATSPGPGVVLYDTDGTIGDIAPGSAASSPTISVGAVAPPAGRLFDWSVEDAYGHVWTFGIEGVGPGAPAGLRVEAPGSDRVRIAWSAVTDVDLIGYRVYRAPDDGSPLAAQTPLPIRRIASYEDAALTPLTRYRYAVAAVDSSGNEGPMSEPLVVSTSPPTLAGWPAPLGESTSASVNFADLDGDGRQEILVGAEVLYVFKSDGTDWIDGDGNPVTTGIFSTALQKFASSPAAADLDQDGVPEVIAASWSDSSVAVWKADGSMMPGWPKKGIAPFWSTPAIGDLDGDGAPDIVVGSNASRVYAWRANGSEIRDGDGNPATDGVFFVPSGTVISSPAIADIDFDGVREVLFGTSAARLYALHADGTAPPGAWPFIGLGQMSASPAVGDIVAGGSLEIAIASGADSVYVITAAGSRAPGWPQPLELTAANGRITSPALAALRAHVGDPSLDVIACGSDGALRAWNPAGVPLPGWSGLALGLNGVAPATEASPTVADLDGDGTLEVLMGADDRRIYAYHFDGVPADGFPIEIGAEALASPAVWDIDDDGSADLVVAGWDRQVHVWRYPGTFLETGMVWPMFRHDAWRSGSFTTPILSAVEADPPIPPAAPSPPARPSLGQNRPNPFNPITVIPFSVPGSTPQRVTIRVYDVSGRVIATLLSRPIDPGYHEVRWDGRGRGGERLPSGVYIYRAEIGAVSLSRKMALLE